MSRTTIPPKVVLRLWLRAGGRCEFQGCNQVLWRDDLTQREINNAYIAHIIADSPNGPRGDPQLSPKLAKEFSNLILLCPAHHTLVDDHPADYPVDLLHEYKRNHEERVEHLTSLDESLKTHLLFFKDNIGERRPAIAYAQALKAVLPRYPAKAEHGTIEINLADGAFRDHRSDYFNLKQVEISQLVALRLRQRSDIDGIDHLSIFALASIPLLIHFGCEVGEITPSDVYQCHRDTDSWEWQPVIEQESRYIIKEPEESNAEETKMVVLNISLSGVIQPDEIAKVMKEPYITYVVTVLNPNRDYLKSREQLDLFAAEMRALLRRIREIHGADCEVHLFAAVPASVAVKLGQLLLPKADPLLHVYEYNQQYGGFRYALTVPRRNYG